MQFRCPNCQHPVVVVDDAPADETLNALECPSCHGEISFTLEPGDTEPYAPGHRLAQFEILGVLGQGGFGTVYKARDTELDRLVALKVPRKGRITPESSRLFLKEARLAAGIEHPHVVRVYEVGQLEDSLYIASEFIDGTSLSGCMKQERFQPRDAASLIIKILRAADEFHGIGIVHRDLKPGNILVDRKREPHIADFGLARGQRVSEVAVTQTGTVMGTLLYMPPEQAEGRLDSISHRSDIYSIGVILYELLTGRTPYYGSPQKSLQMAIIEDEPQPPRRLNPAIPRDLETICLKALEKLPERRYGTASQMADDLQRFLDGKPILARPVSRLERCVRLCRRHPTVSLLTTAVIVLLGILGYAATLSSDGTHRVQILCQAIGRNSPTTVQANWAVVPLGRDTREPDPANAIHVTDSPSFHGRLAPGEYLIVADIPGFGFQEAYRTVPQHLNDEPQGQYANQTWSRIGSEIRWPEIRVLATVDVVSGMVSVPAGTFVMGDENSSSPAHERSVDEFLVDSYEVSVADFLRVMPSDAAHPQNDADPNQPVAFVSWYAATDYAERCGKRLLKEHEMEYLIRDLGKSRYPWGEIHPLADGEWPCGAIGEPSFDRMQSLPVHNLFSNVAEWTDSVWAPYPGSPRPDIPGLQESLQRIVRGGEVRKGLTQIPPRRCNLRPTFRSGWIATAKEDEIGFRCARSRSETP
jgi:serine/threonine protein kinase